MASNLTAGKRFRVFAKSGTLAVALVITAPALNAQITKPQISTSPEELSVAGQKSSREIFLRELIKWAATTVGELDKKFSLDRRFTVLPCPSGYEFTLSTFSVKNSIARAYCKETGWERRLRLKFADQEPSPDTKNKQVNVWIVSKPIKTGELLTPEHYSEGRVSLKSLPKNFQKRKPVADHFAARNLRPGKILTKPDLLQSEKALVAKTTIPRGTSIESHMVTTKMTVAPKNAKLFKNLLDLQYLESNKPIYAGEAIVSVNMRKKKLVKRGEMVVVTATGNGFQIKSKTKSLQDGYIGDQIRLAGNNSSDPIRARVSGKSSAKALK